MLKLKGFHKPFEKRLLMKVKPILVSGLLTLCFWFSSIYVWKYFDSNCSTMLQPEVGRVHPLNTHGSVVYLTSLEHFFLYGLIFASVILFLLTVVLHFTGTNISKKIK